MTCGRIHLGPVSYGSAICCCCGRTMTLEEGLMYWNIRAQVTQIIEAANAYVSDYLKRAKRTT